MVKNYKKLFSLLKSQSFQSFLKNVDLYSSKIETIFKKNLEICEIAG